jgi:hypothetical protein
MGLDAIWQKGANIAYQVWVWLVYEASLHPFMAVGTVIVIISAWILYKTEVRTK